MPFKVNFYDEDGNGNPSGAFCPIVSVQGMDPKRFILGTLTLAAYPTGGFDVAKIVGLCDSGQIESMIVGSSGGYTFEYIPATKKVKGYSAANTEIGNGTDLSALTGVPFFAWGR